MIRLVWIAVREFRGWRGRMRLQLDQPIAVVVGANGGGKSSTLNALEWCLFGKKVEVAGSGLRERIDWEVRPRGAGQAATEVSLGLDIDGREIRVTRQRSAGASGAQDMLSVCLPDADGLNGDAAQDWLDDHGLGDWQDWRRAHCFHQEAARDRVLQRSDRGQLLASLLGLNGYVDLRARIGELRGAELMREVDNELDRLEQAIRQAATRPGQRLINLEQQLRDRHGLDRWQLGPTLEAEVANRLFDRARTLADRLDIPAQAPLVTAGVAAALAWAQGWAQLVCTSRTVLDTLPDLYQARGRLENGLAMARPREQRYRNATNALEEATRDGGDAAARNTRWESAQRALEAAETARKTAHAAETLLQDAAAVLAADPASDRCPVCQTPVPDLPARIRATLSSLRSSTLAALSSVRQQARCL